MESTQPLQNTPTVKPDIVTPATTVKVICGQLADIELKLDHIIETIKDSLHRMNLEDKNREETP